MRFKLLLIFFGVFTLLLSSNAYGQREIDPIIEELIESLAEDAPEDFDLTTVTEQLYYYRRFPLNINKATAEELKTLYILNQLQITSLLTYINTNGPLIDILELQSVDFFDERSIQYLILFASINPPTGFEKFTFKSLIQDGNHDLMMRYGQILQTQRGFLPDTGQASRYLGSPERLYLRYRYNWGDKISIGLNAEKDPGEQFFSGAQKNGFDFYSGNLFIRNFGKLEKLIIGDYSLQFGQGVGLWSGLAFGKGADLLSITKPDIGLRPYGSVNEVGFLRGISGTLKFNKLSITPFISYKKVGASVNLPDTLSAEEAFISSINQTGLHRTTGEIARRNSLTETTYGTNVKYALNNRLSIGATAYKTEFDKPIQRNTQPYNQFDFSGKELTVASANYSFAYQNIYLFGEAAHSINAGWGFLNGALISLSPQITTALLYRSYDRNFHTFLSAPVSEGSRAINEKGFYTGLNIRFSRRWEWVTYADFFQFPWLRFQVDAPSSGYEVLSQVTHRPNRNTQLYFRFKQESKERNVRIPGSVTNSIKAGIKNNYRIQVDYKLSDRFTLKNRAEFATYDFNGTSKNGYLVYQDINFTSPNNKLNLNVRYAIFDTQSFDTRLFAFESNVLYAYSITSHQGRGTRFYATARYRVKRGIDFWVRYTIFDYDDREFIGSGLDRIPGNIRSDVVAQLRFQF